MSVQLVSLDLQGTLSDAAFSDWFWLSELPRLYSAYHEQDTEQGARDLAQQFKRLGRYERAYYDPQPWLARYGAGATLAEVMARCPQAPRLLPGARETVARLAERYPLVVLSSTTHAFIDLELGELRPYFERVISTLDDLSIAGKPPSAYAALAALCGIETSQLLHVGDDALMDVAHAQTAGAQALQVADGDWRALACWLRRNP